MSHDVLINGELALTYPEGFRLMELDELKHAFALDYSDMWGIRDEENHMLISLIWKESNGLLRKLVSTKSLVKEYEKRIGRTFRHGNYRCEEFFETEIAGLAAQGVRFSYHHLGVDQLGELVMFRRGGCNYSLYYYTRPELAQANRPAYEGILASVSFS